MTKDLKKLLANKVAKTKEVIEETPKTAPSTMLKTRAITREHLSPKSRQQ